MEIMDKQELIGGLVIALHGEWIDGASAFFVGDEGEIAPMFGGLIHYDRNGLGGNQLWDRFCTEEEFNATADRMRNKPDWKGAPEWAASLAQDGNGAWWFYDLIVVAGSEAFICPAGCRSRKAVVGKVIGDWRNTLEQRPVKVSSHTIAHFLDKCAAASNVNDWWDYENDKPAYDGALPPVGVKVLLWHKGFKQGVAELVSIKGLELAWWNVDGQRFQHDRADLYGFRPLDHDQNRKPCAEFGLRMANAKNEIDAAAKLCGKNKILSDAVFAIGEQIKNVKKDAE